MKYTLKDIWGARSGKLSILVRLFMDFPTILVSYFVANFTRLSPNQITGFSIFFELLGGVSAFFGNLKLGVLLFFIGAILDGVDGTIARLKNKTSKFGEYLERRFYLGLVYFLGFAFYFYFKFNNPWILGLVALKYWSLLLKTSLIYGSHSFFGKTRSKKKRKESKQVNWFGKKMEVSLEGSIFIFMLLALFNDFYAMIYFELFLMISILKYVYVAFDFLKKVPR